MHVDSNTSRDNSLLHPPYGSFQQVANLHQGDGVFVANDPRGEVFSVSPVRATLAVVRKQFRVEFAKELDLTDTELEAVIASGLGSVRKRRFSLTYWPPPIPEELRNATQFSIPRIGGVSWGVRVTR